MKNKDSFGWCLYRLPGSTEIVRVSGPISEVSESLPHSGFVFAPFDSSKKTLILENRQSEILNPDSLSGLPIELIPGSTPNQSITRKDYLSLTEKAIRALHTGRLRKVVTARFLNISINSLKKDFNLFQYFGQLCQAYPGMFVYLWQHSGGQTWIGATPELLLSQRGISCHTVALAGTRTLSSAVHFSVKEREEQQWVLRYLKETLEDAGIQNVSVQKTTESKAGNLKHLVTPVSFSLGDVDDRWLLIKMLHPTPAVCGYPQQEAFQFIKENESFDRSFYSGFLGSFDHDTMDLFVNIRSMQLHPDRLILYAGAGITSLSKPEAEWEETERKLDTLRRFLV